MNRNDWNRNREGYADSTAGIAIQKVSREKKEMDKLIKTNRHLIGRRSKAAGDYFENMLTASCSYYRDKGVAIIEKTPEPMQVIKPYGDRSRRQYIAYFEKQAQPDYKGVLCDGSAIIFEAKHTDGDRIQESVISETQRKNLDSFNRMGAHCFVMVSIRFEKYFRVPWKIFRDMKKHYGRKYMTLEELVPYRLQKVNGLVLILEGVKLKDDIQS